MISSEVPFEMCARYILFYEEGASPEYLVTANIESLVDVRPIDDHFKYFVEDIFKGMYV